MKRRANPEREDWDLVRLPADAGEEGLRRDRGKKGKRRAGSGPPTTRRRVTRCLPTGSVADSETANPIRDWPTAYAARCLCCGARQGEVTTAARIRSQDGRSDRAGRDG